MLFIHKLRSFSPCLLFCRLHDLNAVAVSGCDEGGRGAARSPCAWLHLTAQEIRDKWRSLVARNGSRWRRRGQVAEAAAAATASEFGYEDDRSQEWDREFPARNFSAMLPASSDRLPPGKMLREEVAVVRS